MTKPTIGQTIYSLNVGNAARNCEQKLTPFKVTKVGRKYFTLGEGYEATQFHLDNWEAKSNYNPNQRLYASESQYAEEIETNDICRQLKKSFNYGRNNDSISIETLRKIKRLMILG